MYGLRVCGKTIVPSRELMIHLARATGEPRAGCSKGLSSKAEASEEAKRYGPHFVYPFALQ